MNFVRLLPVYLSALLIAAHFLRLGSLTLALSCLAFPFLLLYPERWAARTVQVGLLLAALVWIFVLSKLIQHRLVTGMPWIRLTLIIGAVAMFTGSSASVFFWKPLKARYHLDKTESG